MAHYALLNEQNIVVKVITGVDENITQTDLDGTIVGGSSEAWESFYANQPQHEGLTCKRTSYNTTLGIHLYDEQPFRKNYAAIGSIYDEQRDAFYAPQPFPSWILNEDTCAWEAPIEKPDDGFFYVWSENSMNWEQVEPI